MVDESARSRVSQLKFKDLFAHHPNCNQYAHHVITIGSWRLCLGCTVMYLTFIVMLPLDFRLDFSNYLSISDRLMLGLLFFIPAVVQLQLSFHHKLWKALARFFLGLSLWFLLTAIYFQNSIFIQSLMFVVFISGIYIYSRLRNNLVECDTCQLNQRYDSCLIKFQSYLSIPNLNQLEQEDTLVALIMDLKRRARYDDSILLPVHDS